MDDNFLVGPQIRFWNISKLKILFFIILAKGDKKQKKAVKETSSESEAEEAEEDVDENSPKNAKKQRVSGRNSKKSLSPDTNTPPVKPSRSSGRSRRVK